MGRTEEALQLIEDSLSIDKFNFGCRYEKYLITNVVDELSVMKEMMRGEPHNYDEIALDYCAAGCWQEAASLWNIAIAEGIVTPMTYYYPVSYTHLRAHETDSYLVCRLLLEKKKINTQLL